ncbi:biofilm regulation diguanylate cyclase SiaD [Modicisalibacter xianhensis]|uniref:diguanylate cyclase n=1 Tax=Modicisalibacter xianhensis TaxID=442341 RepID=A0A1I2ZF82_9GAMM|nr:biofilm regulation diguanylate cyclase SiaD [Halomonas xianhensis]TDX26163.1 diguanylate cyclase (GGDEF)-like protein [Halomonas xianhensis]SFH36542.1 diguanylate cyclase (GGDEF) domain-containing protein [Halomonas xianhensis]
MTQEEARLLADIKAMIDQPEHRGHPLQQALSKLYRLHMTQTRRLDRLLSIADSYQQFTREDMQAIKAQYDRQVQRERKLSRISDRYQQLMRERNQALKTASSQDPLTGLANRRLLNDHLQQAAQRSKAQSLPFCVAMIDVDHFKRINDQHGHETGDQALVELAGVLKNQLRASDLCGRWGGEEFLVLLSDTSLDQARQTVERICAHLRALPLQVGDVSLAVTASVGVAEHRIGEPPQDTINRADAALLTAKREGRDRYRLAP